MQAIQLFCTNVCVDSGKALRVLRGETIASGSHVVGFALLK